jgi:putative endonuclease
MNQYFVYILLCSDNSYYTGITNDLESRFGDHQTGRDPKAYTYQRRPVKLVFSEIFNDVNQAIAFEKQIKGWRRAKKEAIINGDWHLLPELSKNKMTGEQVEAGPPVDGKEDCSV